MDSQYVFLIAIVLLLVLLFLKMPIAFCLGIAGLVGMVLFEGVGIAFNTLRTFPFSRFSMYALSVLPMFILMGQLAFAARLSEIAFSVGNKWMGNLPGGLCIGTVWAGALFGAACGSTVAASAALGRVAIPEMEKYNYNPRLATGAVSAAGLLSVLIPPSLGFSIYGILTGESIGKLLISGIMPGILTVIIFSLAIVIVCLRNPDLAPAPPKTSWREKIASLPGVSWILLLFLVVMGSIWFGLATPTEAAGAGASATLVIGIVLAFRKKISWGELTGAFVQSVHASSMIFALLLGAGIFSLFLTRAGLPTVLREAITMLNVPRIVILMVILLIYIPLGMFLDPTSMMMISLPIFHPVAIGLGYNGIWFGVIVIKMVEIGCLTPPVGLNIYVVKGVAPNVSMEDIFRGMVPFLIGEFITLFILITFPQISLWLPNLMK